MIFLLEANKVLRLKPPRAELFETGGLNLWKVGVARDMASYARSSGLADGIIGIITFRVLT